MRGPLKILAATALFGMAHSLLASRSAKRAAERVLGTEGRNALYRPFYLAQSVVMFGGLVWYLQSQPRDTLYRVPQPWASLMRVGQAGGLVYAAGAAHHLGIARLLGVPGLAAWWAGRTVPAPAEAQGPAYVGGAMKATGPFRWHRHPLNFAPLPVLWLFPHMTTRLAAMSLASTAYLVLGSMLEETRLRSAYGVAYERYRTSVPFYAPRPPSLKAGLARCPQPPGPRPPWRVTDVKRYH